MRYGPFFIDSKIFEFDWERDKERFIKDLDLDRCARSLTEWIMPEAFLAAFFRRIVCSSVLNLPKKAYFLPMPMHTIYLLAICYVIIVFKMRLLFLKRIITDEKSLWRNVHWRMVMEPLIRTKN